MFELALKAALPVIGVHTDDPVNRIRILQSLAGLKAVELKSNVKTLGPNIYWTDDSTMLTRELYLLFRQQEVTLVVWNPEPDNPLITDVGGLPTPAKFLAELVADYTTALYQAEVAQALKGLSLKRADEILKLTAAKGIQGELSGPLVRMTRSQVGEQVQGLTPQDTSYDFYDFPERLKKWLTLNKSYFLNPATPPKLVPRGVLLDGSPGVGKSMGAKAIARELGVPLYRLDIASTLNRYIGESEARVNRSLAMLERESPCVLLLDEVEKVFINGSDDLVIGRIMSQLLWWLSEHQSRVLTVMTTNDMSAIPSELYRTGRVDMTMRIPRMSINDARLFANMVFKGVMQAAPTSAQLLKVTEALKSTAQDDHSHAEVAEMVYTLIKQHNWLKIV